MFRSAPVRDLQLGATGGSDRTTYYISGSYFDQNGIVIGSKYTRAATRLNLDFNANSKLTVRSSLGLGREDNDRIDGDGSLDGVVTNALGMQPMRPVVRADGSFAGRAEGLRYSNPVALAELNSTELETMRAFGNLEANYQLASKLRLTGRGGFDALGLDETQWESPLVDRTYAASANGVGKSGHTGATKYLAEGFATFEPLSQRHESSIGRRRRKHRVQQEHAQLHPRRRVHERVPDVRPQRLERHGVRWIVDEEQSGRILLARRLVAERPLPRFGQRSCGRLIALRRRQSLRALPGGVGGLGGVARSRSRAALQRFMNLKLRASYGATGNQGIGDFAARALASGSPYSGTPGIAVSQLGNPDLRWETTRELDTGADLLFFNGRVSLTADYYVRHTSDLLVQRPIPSTTGFTTYWGNIGNIQNKGTRPRPQHDEPASWAERTASPGAAR